MLIETYESAGDFIEMLNVSTAYLEKFPGKNPIQIAHAHALVKNRRYQDCLDFLSTVKILPSENSDSGTAIWHEAQDALGHKRTWPENLGKGKPFLPEK